MAAGREFWHRNKFFFRGKANVRATSACEKTPALGGTEDL